MKKNVILLVALLCSSAFAQQHEEHDFVPGPPPEAWQHESRGEDVLQFAQAPGGRGPGIPGGPAGPAGAPRQNPGPGGKGAPMQPPQGGPKPPMGIGGAGGAFPGGPMMPPFQAPAKPTIVVASKLDDAARQSVREDMQIMSRLLDKAAERVLDKGEDRRMGITVTSLPGLRGENIFLEDYGPIFVLHVPMPLAGAKNAGGKETEKSASDWEQTKRELYEKRAPGAFQGMKYDPEKVEALRKALLETLKNASNLRQVKPDQTITVVVSGPGNVQGVINRKIVTRQAGEPAKEQVRHEVLDGKGGPAEPTTLTIRVKKADVDAFAGGKLDAEQFAKKALVN